MPAEFEEIVMAPDLPDLEQIAPDLRQGGFQRTLRRSIFMAEPRALIRLRQGFSVEFTVSGQRHGVDADIGGRDQRLGQATLQMVAQVGDIYRAALAEPRQQPPVTHQHHDVLHAAVGPQCGFDFAGLDAHATQFDLIVIAPQVLERAVRAPTRDVAGAVQTPVRFIAEWVLQKHFGGQCRAIQVAPRNPSAADIQLPGTPTGTGCCRLSSR